MVTGTSSAIGMVVKEMLSELSHDSALFGMSAERLAEAKSRCEAKGRYSAILAFDLADAEFCY